MITVIDRFAEITPSWYEYRWICINQKISPHLKSDTIYVIYYIFISLACVIMLLKELNLMTVCIRGAIACFLWELSLIFYFNFSDLNNYNFSFLTSQGDMKQKIRKSPKPLNLLAFVHNVKCLNINLIKFLIQCDKLSKSALVCRYIMVTLKPKYLCVACSLQLPEMLQIIHFRTFS